MSCKITGKKYAMMYGPTVGDKVRLAYTDLIIEVEKDYTSYGDEVKFGGGKTIRDGMGQSVRTTSSDGDLDLVITNALILDYTGIIKADIGIKNGIRRIIMPLYKPYRWRLGFCPAPIRLRRRSWRACKAGLLYPGNRYAVFKVLFKDNGGGYVLPYAGKCIPCSRSEICPSIYPYIFWANPWGLSQIFLQKFFHAF